MTSSGDTALASKRRSLLLASLIILLATLLRVRQLDDSPIWWDEGNNAYFAHQSLSGIVEISRLTHDTDPPAHRLALKLWLMALGDSVFNLRLLSVIASVGTVFIVLAWGWQWFSPKVGLLAGMLSALSPMMIYYGREAKGYAFVTFFASLALYLLVFRLGKRTTRMRAIAWWGLYIAAETLALGAHYYAILMIAAQGAWLVVDGLLQRPGWKVWARRIWPWIVAQLIVGVVIAPWIWLTWAEAMHGARHVPLDRQAWSALAYLKHVFAHFAAGPHAPSWADVAATSVLLASAVWAIVKDRQYAITWAVLTVVPIGLGYIAQMRIAFFWPRFLLYAVPPFYLLAAWGLTRMKKAVLPLGAMLAIAWAAAVPTAYTPFIGPEEDLRPFAQSLRDTARPGDGVIVGYIWQEGALRVLAPDLPVSYHLGWFPEETVDAQMRALAAEHPRLWLLTYRVPLQHPVNPGGWWLEQRAARALIRENGPTRLALYVSPCTLADSSEAMITFEEGIQLRHAPIQASVKAGEPLAVSLQWSVYRRIESRYTVFVHLYDQAGRLIAQTDSEPRNGLLSFPQLQPGLPATDCRALFIPNDVPPGAYTVVAGLYAPETGQRLLVNSGAEVEQDHALLGEIAVRE